MPSVLKVCEHCGGSLLYDREDKCLKCMMCSRPLVEEANKEQVRVVEQPNTRKSYEQLLTELTPQRDAVVADVAKIGVAATRAKYGIDWRDWIKLRGAWGISTKRGPRQATIKRTRYDDHMQKILADYGQMTIVDLEKKWDLPHNSWFYLKRRWLAQGITIPAAFADRREAKPPIVSKELQTDKAITPEARRVLDECLSHSFLLFESAFSKAKSEYLSKEQFEDAYWETVVEFISTSELKNQMSSWIRELSGTADNSFIRGAIYALQKVKRYFEMLDEADITE